MCQSARTRSLEKSIKFCECRDKSEDFRSGPAIRSQRYELSTRSLSLERERSGRDADEGSWVPEGPGKTGRARAGGCVDEGLADVRIE